MSDDTDKKHIPLLQVVADEDVCFVKEKDACYGSSWKKRGGVGAFMMLARKWDRLENMLSSWSTSHPGQSDYDVFAGIATDYSGADGTIIAEVRDLRRYLLLVEAEMLGRKQQTEHERRGGIDVIDVVVNQTLAKEDWTGCTVRFTPSAAGLAGEMAEMQGQVITDIDGWLKIQCGPGLDALYSEPKSICRIAGVTNLQNIDTNISERLAPSNPESIIDDSSRHATQEYKDDMVLARTVTGLRSLITKRVYDMLSPEMQKRYIVTGDHCQLDRAQLTDSVLAQAALGRFSRFFSQEDVRGLPEWTLELYEPKSDGYYMKEQFVTLWGR